MIDYSLSSCLRSLVTAGSGFWLRYQGEQAYRHSLAMETIEEASLFGQADADFRILTTCPSTPLHLTDSGEKK